MYASAVAEWRYGVRCARGGSHAGCGLCAPAARGRGRESGQRRETAEQRGEGSSADGTALRCAGEAVKAHRECPVDIRRSKCAARVRVAATFGDTEDLFPESSLFMSLRAIGYLLTHADCLLSVRQKKMSERREDRKP